MRVHILYDRLNYQTRQLIDDATGGSLRNKYPDGAKQLFEDMARNKSHWAPRAKSSRVTSIQEVDATTALEAKVDALSRKFDLLTAEKISSNVMVVMLCEK